MIYKDQQALLTLLGFGLGLRSPHVSATGLSEVKDALVAFVEEQVEDAEVGKEALFLFENLIIGFRLKVVIGQGMFGTDGVPEVIGRSVAAVQRRIVGGQESR